MSPPPMDAALVDRKPDDEVLVASPALVVLLTFRGMSVAPITGKPESYLDFKGMVVRTEDHRIPLSSARLHVLAAFGRGARPTRVAIDEAAAATTVSDRADLERFVEALRSGGLLVPAHDEGPPAGPSRVRTDVVDEVDLPATRHAVAADGALVCSTPLALTLGTDGFEHHAHDGSILATLSVPEVILASTFIQPKTPKDARAAMGLREDIDALPEGEHEAAVGRLLDGGILRAQDPALELAWRDGFAKRVRAYAQCEQLLRGVIGEERERERSGGRRRVLVVPIDCDFMPPLSLGMVVAFAKAHDGGALNEEYRFAPLWSTAPDRFRQFLSAFEGWPTMFLFSNYAWNHHDNLEMARAVTETLPMAITVHGGPDTPKYELDAKRHFRDHPEVDVAVRGEGELTFAAALAALVPSIPEWASGAAPDLSPLSEVPGLSYRAAGGIVRTADRERIADLDSIPSPYLEGMVDHLVDDRPWNSITLETNRGCPYGCTFCDWGSATVSRIRKFDLDRVKAEMVWAAERGVEVFSVADANFGMLDRDVEIAEFVVELNRRYGFPTEFQVNYAKNKVGNLTKIVHTLADAGILTQGLIAVQTMDAGVLKTIRRSNIKLERYDALAQEFLSLGLPLYTDVIVGLPGSTKATVHRDFQTCIDRELHIKAHPTQLLVNSPMNDPAYRGEHGIVARPSDLVRQTKTYSEADWHDMMGMRQFMYFCERRGLLRQIATYIRAERDLPEMDFYEQLRVTSADYERWPELAYVVSVASIEFVPPGSWLPLVEEVGRFVVDELGIADDTALQAVLTIQHALLPARGRSFPLTLSLPHDYASWHRLVVDAKRAHPDGSWVADVPPLRSFGPAPFEIDDRDRCCDTVIGANVEGYIAEMMWELDSPVARPKQRKKEVAPA